MPRPKADDAAGEILAWYDRHRRRLPWRAEPGERADPYRVWLSEIMLQQTTVATVGPYFERFVSRWPDVAALAGAELDDVLREWQGLGYYARARNLHKCARQVAGAPGGAFPDDEAELRKLPGIGAYTAAAIAAIAFGRAATPVDGNIERVMARLFAIRRTLPEAKSEIRAAARSLMPSERAGDFAQAMMDLGATICTPRAPQCLLCPWRARCRAAALGLADALPKKRAKPARPVRHAVAFWIVDAAGHVLLRRRPEAGLLGGMMEIPSTPWREARWTAAQARAHAPARTPWHALPEPVRHGFTHFEIVFSVWTAEIGARPRLDGLWWPLDRLHEQALPTAMKKIARAAQARGAP